ncbi:PREDICTED: uncharacterized protein LOC109207065 [Nicotiana attenuata]|uniref:uncharacterized protein LOC109207065 n=1 Tax=Nicotiana attenuata TaxID=49451 RepID=UPI0009054897|nr:PREDICTED: uncharacterized protein LOC109207065 [Nicotiana attenuata]
MKIPKGFVNQRENEGKSSLDYSLFTKKQDKKIVVILVYVDDMLITGNDLTLMEEIKKQSYQPFMLKDLGELMYFLGIEFCRSHRGIMMNQRKYSVELISKMGLSAAKPSWTPLDCNQKLTTTELDEVAGSSSDEPLEEKGQYQRLIGKLLYLTLTRLDIAFAVQTSVYAKYKKVTLGSSHKGI